MARRYVKQCDLEFIAKIDKKTMKLIACGESLVSRTGYSVQELGERVVKDRLRLAKLFEGDAKKLVVASQYRSAVTRSYYAIYHGFRAVSFLSHKGDDYEAHSKLPEGVPRDFPSADHWKNHIKTARLARNKADYEPFPRGDLPFETDARSLQLLAKQALNVVGIYLRSKGIYMS